MTLLEKINDRMDKRHKGDIGLPGETGISNPPLEQDEGGRKHFHYLVSANEHEQETEEEIENTLGTVHVSRPTIKHVFFLLRPLLKPLLEQFHKQEQQLAELVKLLTMEHVFLDRPYAISTNVPYTVDYKGHKFLYLMCQQALSIVVNGNVIATTPGQWLSLSYPMGTQIYGSGVSDASPVMIVVRACDVPMTIGVEQASGFTVTSVPGGTFTVQRLLSTFLNLPNAARASYSQQFQNMGFFSYLAIDFNVTAFTGGTAPTVTFKISRVGADGILYQLEQATAISAAGQISYNIGPGLDSKAFGNIIQIDMVTTGAPTSVTFSTSGQAMS